MQLIRLALSNFRQHADTELLFRPGLTGIIGPNGSGKTTILEAIAWALYGARAVRGTKDTMRYNRAPGRSTVRAELEFELGEERYRVVRTSRSAELYRVEREDPIARGISEVTRQVTRRLGMTLDEFYNTYFTKQKELQFLVTGATERARFLSQVLGYERLRAAQQRVRERRNVLKGQVEELRRTLRDPEEIERDRRSAEEKLQGANAALVDAEGRQEEKAERLKEVEPLWNELQKARDRDRELQEDERLAQARLDSVLEECADATKELEDLAGEAERLAKLRETAKPLGELRSENETLRALQEAATRRQTLEKQLVEQRKRVQSLAGKVSGLEERGRLAKELASALKTRDEACAAAEHSLEEQMSRWQRDRQDVEARLRMLRDQATELKRQIEQIEAAGQDGACPTCKRLLGSEYGSVLELLRGQYEEKVQDGKWHKKRSEQLASEPAEVVTARNSLQAARDAREGTRKELNEAEAALRQAESFKSDLAGEEKRARELAGEIAELPEGYDAARHSQVRQGLERLNELEREITKLETRLERQGPLRKELAKSEEEARQLRARLEELARSRAELAFSEERYREAAALYEEARTGLGEARLVFERARAEVEAARQATEAARRAEIEQGKISRQIGEREKEHRLHNELDGALGALTDELNARVRPELSEIASVFLTELTDGRYNQVEINEDYDFVVLDDGEEKPVISGGEEDLANLVLRLAISQMIADRAGQTLSLLIFDEVFGGLDDQRRESVVRLLQKLHDRFEQVILITHIESIREGLDQVIRVAYDEESGASRVSDESPGAGPEDLAREDMTALVGG